MHWDDEVDVLAGSGGGLCGAYTAAREGLRVAVVEATDKFGGTTAYSGGGGMWFPCNPVLRRAGTDDTIDEALRYYHAVVGDRTPRELQDTYVRRGSDVIEYLESDSSFAFEMFPWPDYFGAVPGARTDGQRHITPVPLPAKELGDLGSAVRGPLDTDRLGAPAPDLLIGGRALIGRFLKALSTFPNCHLHLETALVELVVDDGDVVGAVVEHAGERRAIRATRGVLLAAGGSSRTSRCVIATVCRARRGTPWGRGEISVGRIGRRSPSVPTPI